MQIDQRQKRKMQALWQHLDERSRRLYAAGEALAIGRGGISAISKICGLSRVSIYKGIKELDDKPLPAGRIRRAGAGRPTLLDQNKELIPAIEQIVDSTTRGDPSSPLKWTLKSTRRIAGVLNEQGHKVSPTKVREYLNGMQYSLQGNRKTEEGDDHPDRNEQFEHINSTVGIYMKSHNPVVSVDTKNKELVGNYANSGRKWLKKKSPITVQGHDFPGPEVPRAFPYGIYDIRRNKGHVNIGTDHDTSAFAVASIKGWWKFEGRRAYPKANKLLITADSGGSNSYTRRTWKFELQKFANEFDLAIMVCHFPPGTSKWNKVEHRLFSFIASNWRGEPLKDYETIVNLISHTTTTKGLSVTCRLDHRKYPIGVQVSDDEYSSINIKRDNFHGEWNYIIRPNV